MGYFYHVDYSDRRIPTSTWVHIGTLWVKPAEVSDSFQLFEDRIDPFGKTTRRFHFLSNGAGEEPNATSPAILVCDVEATRLASAFLPTPEEFWSSDRYAALEVYACEHSNASEKPAALMAHFAQWFYNAINTSYPDIDLNFRVSVEFNNINGIVLSATIDNTWVTWMSKYPLQFHKWSDAKPRS